MELSERLMNIIELVTPGYVVADVGCDHAYTAIYLAEQGIAPHVIAMDIGEGPLQRAIEHINEAGLSEYIETRLSDGVKQLNPGEADCLILAGMGGRLMQKIMTEGSDVLAQMKEFILQPQSEIAEFRHFLQDNGYHIISESMVCEEDKFYPMMKAKHGQMTYDREVDFHYGRILLHEENPVLYDYLLREKKMYVDLMTELEHAEKTTRVMERRQELQDELNLVNEALSSYRYGVDGHKEDYLLY